MKAESHHSNLTLSLFLYKSNVMEEKNKMFNHSITSDFTPTSQSPKKTNKLEITKYLVKLRKSFVL